MKQYVLVELLTRCGEYEFTSYLRREIDTQTIKSWDKGLDEAKRFYADFVYEDDGWFYHNNGEVATRLVKVTDLTKEKFDFLNSVM